MKINKMYPLYPMALGIFGITTTEFGIVGILPQIARHFQISMAQAGMLVSMFALVIAVFGPFMTLLFSGINRKWILAGVLAVFTISNVLSAFSPNYTILLLSRLLPAFLHPVYYSVAFAAAASSVSKEQQATAVAKVFNGLTFGMVLGIPITAFIGNQISLESAFLFSGVINAVALLGILTFVPSLRVEGRLSYAKQLNVLAKTELWFNIAAACFILAALYAVYSYFAEYLEAVTGMNNQLISIMLIVFGISGIIGNLQAAKYLNKHMTKTIIFYPIVLGAVYFLVYYIGNYVIPMAIIIIVWGAVFTGGLIISQTWLTSAALEAPEFANSLFVSFANLGVTIGTTLGGWFLSQMGTHQIIWSGELCLILACICIGLKIKLYSRRQV